MFYKKRYLIFTILFIILLQVLLYINNNNKSNLKFFIWEIREIEIGKLLSVSFFSGILMSSIINYTTQTKIINKLEEEEEELDKNESVEAFTNIDEKNSSFEMPPQRDIRDPQPTISVNYRVVKNNSDNYQKYGDEVKKVYEDDWIDDIEEW